MAQRLLAHYPMLAEAIPQIVWIADAGGNVLEFNGRWTEYTGLSQEESCGKAWMRALHPDDLPRLNLVRRSLGRRLDRFEVEYRIRGANGEYRWFLSRALPVLHEDGSVEHWFGTSTDIDDQKRAETTLRFLSRCGQALGESLDATILARDLARLIVPELADDCAVFGFREQRLFFLAAAHVDPACTQSLVDFFAQHPPRLDAPTFDDAVTTGVPVLIRDLPSYARNAQFDEEQCAFLARMQTREILLVPLKVAGEPVGLLWLSHSVLQRSFDETTRSIADDLAHRTAIALDHAQRYEQEHRVAKKLQEAMLPTRIPVIPGAVCDAVYVPAATELLVGGDWWDVFEVTSASFGLSIGDVTGHGLDAAVVMGELRQSLRSAAIEGEDPARILDHADRVLRASRAETIATAGFGLYEPARRRLSYATAGHPPPLIARPNGSIVELRSDGLPLGMRTLGPTSTTVVGVESGSMIVFYTDGLIEYERDAVAGERRLRETVAQLRGNPVPQPARAIYQRVVREVRHTDDTAVLVLTVS